MESRLSLSQLHNGDWKFLARLDAVEKAISISRSNSRPVFVVGEEVHEEFLYYVTSKRKYIDYSYLTVNNSASHPFDLLRSAYWGRTATLRRMMLFLSQNFPRVDLPISETGILACASMKSSIVDQAARAYVSSRKSRDGAGDEILELISNILTLSINGPLVISCPSSPMSFIEWISLISCMESSTFPPTVILTEPRNNKIEPSDLVVNRYPISEEEFLGFMSGGDIDREKDVKRYLGIWKASRPLGIRRTKGGPLSTYECNQFINFYKQVDAGENPIEVASKAIPQKIAAPIMFAEINSMIDVDPHPANGLSASAARGAARAIRNQANDVISSGGLQNISPGLNRVVSRIALISEKIECSDAPIEADIIELGVEISYFDSRIYEAKDRLGEMSKGEVLAFSAEARRFINRFDSWKSYDAETREIDNPQEAVDLAEDLMRHAISAGILTEDAKSRIESALSSDEAVEAGHKEGITRSTENLASVLGRSALEAVKKTSVATADEARAAVAKGIVGRSGKFITEQAPSLIRLSQLRGGRWMEMLAEIFDGKGV